MRKNLPQIINQLTSPSLQLNNQLLSPSRFFNKRAMLKQCKKLWGYHNETELDRQIAFAYTSLKQAIKSNNSPMTLRYLSINLYQQYLTNKNCFQLQDNISNISILNCGRVKNQNTGIQWFHISTIIKHFNTQYLYGLERRIYVEDYKFQDGLSIRKWCFNRFPLKEQQKQISQQKQE